MGNTVVFEKDPPSIDYLLGKRIKKDLPREDAAEPTYNSALFFWRFEKEKDKDKLGSRVSHNPVSFPVREQIDKKSAYLVLHVYRLNGRPAQNDTRNSLPLITDLTDELQKCFTPRGASAPLGTCPCISAGGSPGATGLETTELLPLCHDTYVWSGREAAQLAVAQARAKGIAVDRRLVKHHPKLLRVLFCREPKVPLGSVFCTAVDMEDDYQNLLMADNRLFSQLLYQAVSGNVQFVPLYSSQLEDVRAYGDMLRHTTALVPTLSASSSEPAHKDKKKHESSGLKRALTDNPPPSALTDSPMSSASTGTSLLSGSVRVPTTGSATTSMTSRPSFKAPGGISLNTARARQVQDDMLRQQEHEEELQRSRTSNLAALSVPSPSAAGASGSAPAPPFSISAPGELTLSPKKPSATESRRSDGGQHIAASVSASAGSSTGNPPMTVLSAAGTPMLSTRSSLMGTLPPAPHEDFRISDPPLRFVGEPEPEEWKALQAFYLKVCSRITRFLYLGSKTVASDIGLLRENGITHILNCAGAASEVYFPQQFRYRVLWLLDGNKEDVASLFYDTIEWIDEARVGGGRVFIHCEKGISRSSTMAIAYLMQKLDADFHPTAEAVKRIRKVASPNANFIVQLLNWSQRRRSAVTTTRVFLITMHSAEDPQFVAKVLSTPQHPPVYRQDLREEHVYLLETPGAFVVWRGAHAKPEAVAAAHRICQQMQKHEKSAPEAVREVASSAVQSAADIGLRDRPPPAAAKGLSHPSPHLARSEPVLGQLVSKE